MPAEVINLNRARKTKARDEKNRKAAENRVAFGRTKAEKAKQTAEHKRIERALDAHRRRSDDNT